MKKPWDKTTPHRHKVLVASDKLDRHAALCTCGWERLDCPTRDEAVDVTVEHLKATGKK